MSALERYHFVNGSYPKILDFDELDISFPGTSLYSEGIIKAGRYYYKMSSEAYTLFVGDSPVGRTENHWFDFKLMQSNRDVPTIICKAIKKSKGDKICKSVGKIYKTEADINTYTVFD